MTFSPSWPGLSRPSTSFSDAKTWMPGTRPGMTDSEILHFSVSLFIP